MVKNMNQLAAEVRKLVYTVICFQCLLQLTAGSPYQKYLKLFSYLLTMCICCTVVFSAIGQVKGSLSQSDALYQEWEKSWSQYNQKEVEQDVREMAEWFEEAIGSGE
ncbi:MAG: hypothetical protein HFJ07_16205 [Lachnospiraceae bacterium]|jgi:fructoselysine-6-P-deglycase FrlB-like protein|nr:hypothetical protein [Lachnospiraceae bacterium]